MIIDQLIDKINALGNPSVVGMDTDAAYLPEDMQKKAKDAKSASSLVFEFNRNIIDKIHNAVPAVKVQAAYYEMLGAEGYRAFGDTLRYAKSKGMITIADVKRNDIGSTAAAYSKAFFSGVSFGENRETVFESDFITLNGYLGIDGIAPFLQDAGTERGVFILVKTSNPSSSQLQDLRLSDGRAVYEAMGGLVKEWGAGKAGKHGYSAVGAVVGATHPSEAAVLRSLMPETFFLVPGYGAQGGTAKDLKPCFDGRGGGAIVNSSRGIICAYKSKKYFGLSYADAALEAALDMKKDITEGIK
jgi:orotidine-5'-phosphate decarboxylase